LPSSSQADASYAAFFIRRDSMTLGDSAQDSSAVPDDFLIAEVYKEKDKEKFVHLFLLSRVPVVSARRSHLASR
jgi:hypothetical protein